MRSRVLALIATNVLICCAQAQFLQPPQYDSGANLAYFVQSAVIKGGATSIIGVQVDSDDVASTNIVVLPANGTGGFGVPITTAISGVDNPKISQLLLGDFNDDGKTDVVVFGTDHVTGLAAVAVMLGNGNGTFQTGTETVLGNIAIPTHACAQAAGDYTGDGKLDVAYLGSTSSTTNLVVLPGKGDGTFSAAVTTVNAPGMCLATGDFNNDKKLDAAVSSGKVSMMLGNGNGTFQTPFVVAEAADQLFATELNGDGNLDLVAVSLFGDAPPEIFSLLGDGTGHFPSVHGYPATSEVGMRMSGFAVQDLNGDGRPDVATYSSRAGAAVHGAVLSIFLNNGDGTFTGGKFFNGDGQWPTEGLFAADLNGDNKTDLAIPNSAGGVSVFLGKGNGTFPVNPVTGIVGNQPQVGNFNADTIPDIVVADSPVQVLLGKGDGTFNVQSTACNLQTVAIGDYNNDKKLDIAGNSFLDGVPVVTVCLGNGNGTFTVAGNFDQGVAHSLVVPGNFMNNGKLDLAANDEHGFSVLLGEGSGAFENGIPTSVDATNPTIYTGYFTSGTKLDVIAITDTGVAVFPGNGNGTFGSPIVAPATPSSQGSITVTDLNNDGKKDAVITSGGHVVVMLGNGDGTFKVTTYALGIGIATRAVVGDFNGDGKLDVAFGLLNNDVGVMFGDGTGKLSALTTFRTGSEIKGIASADFNLDNKPDLAVLLNDGYLVTLLNQ